MLHRFQLRPLRVRKRSLPEQVSANNIMGSRQARAGPDYP
jgi:hypothetical protein